MTAEAADGGLTAVELHHLEPGERTRPGR
jgi:hypothetical protein